MNNFKRHLFVVGIILIIAILIFLLSLDSKWTNLMTSIISTTGAPVCDNSDMVCLENKMIIKSPDTGFLDIDVLIDQDFNKDNLEKVQALTFRFEFSTEGGDNVNDYIIDAGTISFP